MALTTEDTNSTEKSIENSTENSIENGTEDTGEKATDEVIKKGTAKRKKTAKQYAIAFFVKVGVTALIVVLLLLFVFGIYVNHSNSGYPMVKDGDLVLTFRLAQLHKGDAIVYEKDGETKFGRIVAEAGDVVDLNEDGLTVNGYGTFEDTVYPTTAEGATLTFPYTVPEDTVFVLNDYRPDAHDSRIYGGIPLKDTKGKIIFLLRKRGV